MLIAAVLFVLAIIGIVALQVDDWSRDLSTNYAATSVDAKDPTLRSLDLDATVEEVSEAIKRFVSRAPAWSLGETTSDADDAATLHLVRTTRLLRFADDVKVFLQVTDIGTRVDVASQSRIGKGDFGQNPRNVRELLLALRDELDVNAAN